MRPVSSMLGAFGVGLAAARRPREIAVRAGVLAVVAAALCVPRTARAGHYSTVVYSSPNGKITVTPPVTGSPFAYSASQGSWGGTYGGGGSVDCNGQITATFTWVPDYDGEPPPDTVIVKKTAMAVWGGYGMTPPTGSCSNGLGDSVQGSLTRNYPFWSATYTSSGTHYSVEAGGLVLTFACTPTAQASSTMYAHAAVWYSCEVTPVVCTPVGVTIDQDTHEREILIGQGCTGTLSAGSYTLQNHAWSMSGDVFKEYVAHGVASGGWAQVYPLTSADCQTAAPHWYWRSDGGGGYSLENVYGQADAYVGSQFVGTVHDHKTVTVWAPTYLCSYNARSVTLDVDAGKNVFIGAGSWTQHGIDWYGQCEPAAPTSLFGWAGLGDWSFVQLICSTRSILDDGIEYRNPDYGVPGLDTSYPYKPDGGVDQADDPDLGWPDNFDPQTAGDSPCLYNVQDTVSYVNLYDRFWTVMMYRPADVGNGHQWVPLHEVRWQWSNEANRPGASWVTQAWPYKTVISPVSVTLDQRWTYHPEWSRVCLAGMVRVP